jgi:hypothetical protein
LGAEIAMIVMPALIPNFSASGLPEYPAGEAISPPEQVLVPTAAV